MDCSPWGSSVHGILQAWILEWLSISSSRGPSPPGVQTRVSCTADPLLFEPPGKLLARFTSKSPKAVTATFLQFGKICMWGHYRKPKRCGFDPWVRKIPWTYLSAQFGGSRFLHDLFNRSKKRYWFSGFCFCSFFSFFVVSTGVIASKTLICHTRTWKSPSVLLILLLLLLHTIMVIHVSLGRIFA